MRIHVIAKCAANTEDAQFMIQISDHGISITRVATGVTATVTLFDAIERYPGGVAIKWSEVYGFVLVSVDSLINDKGLGAYLVQMRNIEQNIATIVPNEEGTALAAVIYTAFTYTGEIVEVQRVCGMAEAVNEVFPGYLESRTKFRDAKIDLLSAIGSNDSLSSLEKQVDLLSTLVIALVEKQPEYERPDWLSQFKTVIEQGSSLRFKGPLKAIEDIAERKAHIRALQEQYFKTKNGVV